MKKLESIITKLARKIPHGLECTGCPYLSTWWWGEYCHLTDEKVEQKICTINEEGI